MKISDNILNRNSIFESSENTAKIDNTANAKSDSKISSLAAIICISDKGKSLSQGISHSINNDELSPAEAKLKDIDNELSAKKEKKKKAAELEEQISTDETLTDRDKMILQKRADKLKADGMTTEDKYYLLQDKKNSVEKDIMEGKSSFSILSSVKEDIRNTLEQMKKESELEYSLQKQANQERADKAAEQMKVDITAKSNTPQDVALKQQTKKINTDFDKTANEKVFDKAEENY